MEAMRECCCGMDVHQATVIACVIKGPLDQKPKVQIKQFSTVTSSLEQLCMMLVTMAIVQKGSAGVPGAAFMGLSFGVIAFYRWKDCL